MSVWLKPKVSLAPISRNAFRIAASWRVNGGTGQDRSPLRSCLFGAAAVARVCWWLEFPIFTNRQYCGSLFSQSSFGTEVLSLFWWLEFSIYLFSGSTAIPSFRRVQYRNCGTNVSGYWWLKFPICSLAVPRFHLFARVQIRNCGNGTDYDWSSQSVLRQYRGSPPLHRVQFRNFGTNRELARVPPRYSKVQIRYCWETEKSIRYCFGAEWALIRYWNFTREVRTITNSHPL